MGEIDFPVGKPINEVRVWFGGVRIVFELGERVEPDLYIDLSDFDYQDADVNRSHPDVKKPETLGSALKLIGRAVTSASTEEVVLELTFDDGSALRCPPDPDYEAWQVVGGRPNRLGVSLPGGGLSVSERPSRLDYVNHLGNADFCLRERSEPCSGQAAQFSEDPCSPPAQRWAACSVEETIGPSSPLPLAHLIRTR